MTTSSHLNWLIIRDNNAFLLKKGVVEHPFSTDVSNLINVSSYRYSGLVHKKTVGIVPTADTKVFTAVLRKGKYAQRPSKNTIRVSFKSGHRASAVVRFQKSVQANKGGKKTE